MFYRIKYIYVHTAYTHIVYGGNEEEDGWSHVEEDDEG